MKTTPELAIEYRRLWDLLDDLDDRRKSITSQMDAVEREIKEAMSAAGKVNDGDADTVAGVMRISVRQKWRSKYEPSKWSDIVKWCADNDRDYLIQRRLSDAKIMELVDNNIALPDGLSVEPFSDLDFRRL